MRVTRASAPHDSLPPAHEPLPTIPDPDAWAPERPTTPKAVSVADLDQCAEIDSSWD